MDRFLHIMKIYKKKKHRFLFVDNAFYIGVGTTDNILELPTV